MQLFVFQCWLVNEPYFPDDRIVIFVWAIPLRCTLCQLTDRSESGFCRLEYASHFLVFLRWASVSISRKQNKKPLQEPIQWPSCLPQWNFNEMRTRNPFKHERHWEWQSNKDVVLMASTLIDWSQGVSNFPACYGCCSTYSGGRMSKERWNLINVDGCLR